MTCFESRGEIGGQWAAQPDVTPQDAPEKVQSSIYDGVVLNSCRDTSALPDFPADPARYGDYFSHRHQLRYLREYAEHFGLLEHIRFKTRVLSCVPEDEGQGVGPPRWRVTIRGEGEAAEEEVVFDALFVGAGHLSTPSIPNFAGRDAFKGEFLHSHYYRRPGPFERKKVALIGFGSSAVDIACELAPGAEEVHLITRRGGWVLPRYVLGKPTEAWDSEYLPTWSLTEARRGKILIFRCRQGHTGLDTAQSRPMGPDQVARSSRGQGARGDATQTQTSRAKPNNPRRLC